VDRLTTVLNRLGPRVGVSVRAHLCGGARHEGTGVRGCGAA
jgi:hypothetical protein